MEASRFCTGREEGQCVRIPDRLMCEGWNFQGYVKLTLRLSVQLQSRQPYESDLHAGVKPSE